MTNFTIDTFTFDRLPDFYFLSIRENNYIAVNGIIEYHSESINRITTLTFKEIINHSEARVLAYNEIFNKINHPYIREVKPDRNISLTSKRRYSFSYKKIVDGKFTKLSHTCDSNIIRDHKLIPLFYKLKDDTFELCSEQEIDIKKGIYFVHPLVFDLVLMALSNNLYSLIKSSKISYKS